MKTRAPENGPPPEGDAAPVQTVQENGAQAALQAPVMPLHRDVYLLESPAAPVDEEVRSSAVFAAQIIADSSASSVERIEQKVEALLRRMTLEEKVGQMTQLTLGAVAREGIFPTEVDPAKLHTAIHDYHVGSLLNVAGTALSLEQWHGVIAAIQEEAAQTRLGIPVLYGIDAVHGANYTQEAILFPQNQGLAATWNPALAQETAAITARDVRASGIPWNFAPVLDIGREPRWPRFYETLGEDTHLATVMGLALVRGYQGTDVSQRDRVAACLKHYVGYSGPETGLDRTPAVISDIELREQYLPTFQAAIKAGARSIMINSGGISGVPVHSSRYLLTEVLREELGFEGLVVSDWQDIKKLVTVHHVAATEREASKMAVMAGVDMSMVPSDFSFYEHLLALVRAGEVPETRINEAVRRILRLKFALGLFEEPMRGTALADEVGGKDDHRVALQAARESITLLRNKQDLLPLSEDLEVLVTGPTAHSMQSLNNGWTYTWQGGGRAQELFHEGRPTIKEAIRLKVGADRMTYVPGATLTEPYRMDEAVAAARTADVAVVALGEGAYAETPGNILSLMLPEAQRTLLERLAATGTPVVLVLVEGRPRVIGEALADAEAILAAYNPGTEGGQAIMEVLYGVVNPSGHLPFTYPRSPVGTVTYDRKYSEMQEIQGKNEALTPLFAFGHGLSYTEFSYSDLTLSRSSMQTAALQDAGEFGVSVTVTNTGERAGKDVVQLYVSDLYASVAPSVRELERFAKVQLFPGESTELTFSLDEEAFSFIGRDGEPVVEPGTFHIQIDDLEQTFELEGDPFMLVTTDGHRGALIQDGR